MPGETAGLAPDPAWKVKQDPNNPWSIGDTVVTAIGQGYNLVSPLQLMRVTAAVANGGTLLQPQLVLNVTDPSGKVVQDYKTKVAGQVPVSPQNLAVVREGMHQVVADKRKGTAYRMVIDPPGKGGIPPIQIGGKTGTAEYGEEIEDPITHLKHRRSHAWFTAFAPFDKPEIAIVVLLEGGDNSLEGSTWAVPIADKILQSYFHVVR